MRSISSWKINLTKFRDNIKKVQDITKSKLMIMLKAQAYGHGLFEMVESLDIYKQDEISIGVASLQEAIAIRKICPQCQLDIYVFSEILIQEEKFHEYYLDFNITPIISSLKDLKDLLSYKELSSLPIYLKFNTGMNRLGIEFNELEDIFQLLKINQRKQVQHVMSHFACSYIKGHTLTEKQCEKFEKILKAFDQNNIEVKEQSIANSGAIEQGIGYQYTHVRPGLMLYGPSSFFKPGAEDFWSHRLISRLETTIMKVSKVSKGDVIGYGATKINENGYVAIIPLGYGDGIPLSISGFSWDFEGVHVKAIGRVNMDMCFLFLPEHIDPKKWENKKINLWGDDQQILSKLAAHCGVHPYYIFCTITGRIPREYHLE